MHLSKTKIEWADETWNCITGCTPLSAGCANCYARKNALRMQGNPNPKIARKYRNGFDLTVHPDYLDVPFHWKKQRRVFVNSMSDTFHRDVPVEFIRDLFDVITRCPQHIFQVLTKRADRLADLSEELPWPENLWIGTTVEDSDHLDRLDYLRRVPGAVRFVSFEPLLSELPSVDLTGIHWVIVGGESGSKARQMDIQWARDLRDRSLELSIPFFFKQVGGRDKTKGGRLLDGLKWNDYPYTQLIRYMMSWTREDTFSQFTFSYE
jgi:protein gp37